MSLHIGFNRKHKFQAGDFSLYEVGRSELGQALPMKFTGSVSFWRWLVAFAPLALALAVIIWQVATAATEPSLEVRIVWLALLGTVPTFVLLTRLSYLKTMNGIRLLHMYAQEHIQPALHYSGVLASLRDTAELLERKTVGLDPNQNLYEANTMRLVRAVDGNDIIQFERS